MNELTFKPRIAVHELTHWAERYQVSDEERRIEAVIAPAVQTRGFYEREEFLTLCRWRSPRAVARCRPNDPDFVHAATRVALSDANERIRIGVLRLLKGVYWPTASVLLHIGHRDRYPIVDRRVLWSVGVPSIWGYTFELWWAYVEFCRTLTDTSGLSMRALDRALWQYCKERWRQLSSPA
jgi:hypothetical protein